MNNFSKSVCLMIYALAIASFAVSFPDLVTTIVRYGALLLLVAHAVEVVVCFKYLKLYQGPIAVSIGLTLLFGLLHWKPLANMANSAAARQKTE